MPRTTGCSTVTSHWRPGGSQWTKAGRAWVGWEARGQTDQGLGPVGGQGTRDCVSTLCLFGEADMKCRVLGWDSPVVGESWGRLGF